ncbi:hypothetical protein O181_117944 [Austropuccinia psidii MF-1]|uniref:Retrotransposon gag domain-containing protein n=1 Tax=Austropuccinia psidii MF-1 TaxID=1389203 RepID=A0A9Q3KEA7_9BASI|nr:hypothetical protein [Austropuccinia psidii MF-1]
MEAEEPFIRGSMKSRRLTSFSGLLGGYPGIFQGPRNRLGEAEDKEEKESVEEEGYDEDRVAPSLEDDFESPEAPHLSLCNQPHISQTETGLLRMMEKMIQFMVHLTQEVSPRDIPKVTASKTPSMKAPDSFDGTKAHKLRVFPQSCQVIFYDEQASFFSDRRKVIYSTNFLTGRAGKWIEPYLSNIPKKVPYYLLNNWKLFETNLFTLFGDPNEVRKAEQVLDNLKIKESGHVSLYMANFKSLMSRIRDLGESSFVHVYRINFESRLLDQISSHPGEFDILQAFMNINLEVDTRYYARKK